ncbi:hypothetical protein ACWEN3_38675, partial [Streptomyces sp. NPDC004561]
SGSGSWPNDCSSTVRRRAEIQRHAQATEVNTLGKVILRSVALAAAASACLAAGVCGASASEGTGTGSPQANSVLRCYATSKNPQAPVCYRLSAKAEFRHGQMVYIPMLIQVPAPSHPSSVTIVNSLNDIHPNEDSQNAPM